MIRSTTWEGQRNTIFPPGEGIRTNQSSNIQLPERGVSKLRIDRHMRLHQAQDLGGQKILTLFKGHFIYGQKRPIWIHYWTMNI